MKKYKVNIVWEAEIEMELDENDPMEDFYMHHNWDEIFQAMREAGIYEDESVEGIEEEG